ncbi:MAG: tRNA (adenosine(37)-N6)-threonylcarbamoyltransferase complex dimerization subunit type 1 TsaB, partial [Gammaproteobacteria bacterium]|nr:tRNA (adenosine(37)-N6)-threonylcarbamoyltransferase complex dimerization subunit type 1 TsaB [Gammaproteobacteria bacterium]
VEAGVALGALDAIAFGRGPGAFTGVRLAASVTQGLAFGAGLGVVPVSDLRALAQRALAGAAGEGGESAARVLACMDARMREVYWGCYERVVELAVPVGEERVGDPGAVTLPAAWGGHDPGPGPAQAAGGGMQGVGSGFSAYPQLRAALGSRLGRILAELRPRAAEIALLASAEVAAGRVFPAEQALPVYVRDEVVRAPGGSH